MNKNITLAALSLSALFITQGCIVDGSDSQLPSAAAFYVPTPEGSRNGQALCESGTTAHDAALELIDEQNDALSGDRELIDALLLSSADGDVGFDVYSVEVDGRTLRVEVISAGDSYTYTGTLTEDGETVDYLTGAMADGGNSGSLTITPPGEDELNVAWREQADGIDFVRSGASDAVVSEKEDSIAVVVGETILSWDLTNFEGVLISDGDVLCFEGGASSDDFCDVTCDADALSQVGQ